MEPARKPASTTDRAGHERRSADRRRINVPVLVFPVAGDGGPDPDRRTWGTTLDIAGHGIALELHSAGELPTPSVVAGFPGGNDGLEYIGIEVLYRVPLEDGRTKLGATFRGFAEEILQPGNLIPQFDPILMQYDLPFPQEVLDRWVAVGVLKPEPIDRILLCPGCHGLPTFRQGCSNCGSARVTTDRLIHHRTCDHVGPMREFHFETELICPKCRYKLSPLATDVEYFDSPNRCLDCSWNSRQLDYIAQCVRCDLRFTASQAYEEELKGYRVSRLNPAQLLRAG